MQWALLASVLQASARTGQPVLVKNGYAAGECRFKSNGELLTIHYGSDRSGLGFATDWYAYANGAWKSVPALAYSLATAPVKLGECDRGDDIDISNRFQGYAQLLPANSKIKYVHELSDKEHYALIVSSRPAPDTQTGSLIEVSLNGGEASPVFLGKVDLGKSRFCKALWNRHRDGTRNLIVYTLEPAGSSASYAFQSFAIRK